VVLNQTELHASFQLDAGGRPGGFSLNNVGWGLSFHSMFKELDDESDATKVKQAVTMVARV
jgi:hypothetical protein